VPSKKAEGDEIRKRAGFTDKRFGGHREVRTGLS
jgi:hypothetical protein